jgi:hypothetical protein
MSLVMVEPLSSGRIGLAWHLGSSRESNALTGTAALQAVGPSSLAKFRRFVDTNDKQCDTSPGGAQAASATALRMLPA